jgi:hypothetical protein
MVKITMKSILRHTFPIELLSKAKSRLILMHHDAISGNVCGNLSCFDTFLSYFIYPG